METPTALVIGQLTDYLRGLTQRLDPGAGWYGEFLRRDPEGMRACLDGVAMPPWDVLESLLGDLPGAPGNTAGEAEYAASLRAAAVAAWDAMPGGAQEVRTLLAAAARQRAVSEEALRTLTARLGGTADPAQAAALARELAWTRDDAARAAARCADLAARLAALPPEPRPEPLPAVPAQREGRWLRGARRAGGARYAGTAAAVTPPPAPDGAAPELPVPPPRGARFGHLATDRTPPGTRTGVRGRNRGVPAATATAPAPPDRPHGTGPATAPAHAAPARPATAAAAPDRARYADPAAPGAGGPASDPASASAPAPGPGPDPASASASASASAPADPAAGDASVWGTPAGAPGAAPRGRFVAELLALRAQGRSGEAHALLCEAAAWPAAELPGLAAELGRAGLAADWATLLWEAASLPPDRLAAAAAALGEAGREADCDGLLRQGVARPAAEVAEAALALGDAGRDREAQALLGAFVRLRTAEEAAGLARRDPHWFAPRLLRAARALSGTRHRDLAHALRVAGIAVA
ncbi:hypothetical protein [Streptomyces sp. NBC_00091]|uniref:hypothetical protein n=1 Tax=Streptomyces sp. NBC_00091 TaxID=2975648 RepID=UPI00225BAA91|nr:hypothetical protein [Streptomyces sp. NBC_00091]MCX5374994.1 hypothetical protein [Streptomyces sp. NBC_00091]